MQRRQLFFISRAKASSFRRVQSYCHCHSPLSIQGRARNQDVLAGIKAASNSQKNRAWRGKS
jgi:hypothetical protein